MTDLGSGSLGPVDLGAGALASADLGSGALAVAGLGEGASNIFTNISDVILALSPIWAMDALTSLVGYSHLDPVDEALDLVGTNHAVQADSAKQPLYDATANNGRGGIYGQSWVSGRALITPAGIAVSDEYTHVMVLARASLSLPGSYPGFASLRNLLGAYDSTWETYDTTPYSGIMRTVIGRDRGGAMQVDNYYSRGGLGLGTDQLVIQRPSTPGTGQEIINTDRTTYNFSVGNSEITTGTKAAIGQGYSSSSNLVGWISTWYIFDRILTDLECQTVIDEIASRTPNYFRDALPAAWSHFEFREQAWALPYDTVAEDSASGIPAGGALTNGVLTRAVLGSESNPMGFDFDGVNDYVQLPAGTLDFVQGTGVFTLECFGIMSDGGGPTEMLIVNWDGSATTSFLWDRFTTAYRFSVGGLTLSYSNAIEFDGPAPHHFVVTGDGATVRLYLDGSELASGPFTGGLGASGVNPTISHPTFLYKGKINEANIHQVALTPAEIQARGRLYRGDLGQRLIDGFGTGATGLKHLFMQEEIRSETTFEDRITAATGTHYNGVETGVYSAIRGTTRAARYDGVNDYSGFSNADFDLDTGAGDSFSMFSILKAGTVVNARCVFGKIKVAAAGSPPQYQGVYAVYNTGGSITSIARNPVKQLTHTLSVAGKNCLLCVTIDRGAALFKSILHDLDSGTSEALSVSLATTADLSNSDDLWIGALPGVFNPAGMDGGVFGCVQKALSADEIQWIADIAKWS